MAPFANWIGNAIDGRVLYDPLGTLSMQILGDIEARTAWNAAGFQLDDSSGNGNNMQLASGYACEFIAANSDYTTAKNLGNIKSIEFWIKLGTTTESIIDLNGTNHIDVAAGTIDLDGGTSEAYYVNGVAGSTIGTDWTHVVISQATDIAASAMEIGRIAASYGDFQIKDLKFYSTELSSAQAAEAYNNPQQDKPTGATLVAAYLTGQSYITDNFVIFDVTGNGNHLTFLSSASAPYLAHIDNVVVGKQVTLSSVNKYPWFGPFTQNWGIVAGTNPNISPLGVGQYVEITFFWFNSGFYFPFNYLLIRTNGIPRIRVNGLNLDYTLGACTNNTVNTVRITRTATNDFKYTLNGVDQQTLTAAGTDSNFLFIGTNSVAGFDNGICVQIDMNGTVYKASESFAPAQLGSSSGSTVIPRWVNIMEDQGNAGNDILEEPFVLSYFNKLINFYDYETGGNKTTPLNIGNVKTLLFLFRTADKDTNVTIAETGTGNTIALSSGAIAAADFDTIKVDVSTNSIAANDTWYFVSMASTTDVNLSAFAFDQNFTNGYIVGIEAYAGELSDANLQSRETALRAFLP